MIECDFVTDTNQMNGNTLFIESLNATNGEIIMKNVGGIDRPLRIIVGLILISLVFVGPQTPWGWLGLVPLLTGAFGFCLVYKILGINSCPIEK